MTYENTYRDDMYLWFKIYWEFYHGVIYIVNEGLHARMYERL
jgi:hypothetical protein